MTFIITTHCVSVVKRLHDSRDDFFNAYFILYIRWIIPIAEIIVYQTQFQLPLMNISTMFISYFVFSRFIDKIILEVFRIRSKMNSNMR